VSCESDSEVVNVEMLVSEVDAGPGEPGMSVCPWAGGQAAGFPSTLQSAFVLSGLDAPSEKHAQGRQVTRTFHRQTPTQCTAQDAWAYII
jgi:hypothetical protein